MKKFVLVALALMLALPAVSFAGSATSRWDVTIGGFVKADFGWADQSQNGADYLFASRKDYADATPTVNENRSDRYGNTYMAAGETRLSLAIKGPDAGSAKTGAYIEGEFTGATGAASSYGLFRLRHAFMKMDWSNVSLLLGQTWDNWGVIFPDLLGRNEGVPMRRGVRAPQVRVTWNINPNFNWYIMAFQANAAAQGTWNSASDDFARSFMPAIASEFTWTTDKCGKIGNDQMLFALSGMVGQEKVTYKDAAAPGTWSDDKVNTWGTAFKGFIPIIPQKKNDKAMSLFLKGQITYGQNWRTFSQVGASAAPYDRDFGATSYDYVAPVAYGWYAQMGFYFTDKLWANFYYGMINNALSSNYQWNGLGSSAQVKQHQQYSGNLIYDWNPAVRLGLQYTYLTTEYAGFGTSNSDPCTAAPGLLRKHGNLNAVRAAAWYFF